MRRDAFERLYDEYAEPLLGFLIYRTADRQLAEDILGDTFERAIHARQRFNRRKASEKTWLYAIAMNCLTDHRRRARAESKALEQVARTGGGVAPDTAETVADRDAVARAMTALSDDEQDAIALRYGAELTIPEIADLTGMPESTARGRIYGAMAKLRDELSDE